MNTAYYVYVIFRLNGQPCYVGKGSGVRWKKHKRSHNKHLASIIIKEGDLPIVKIRTGLTETEAFLIETSFIKAIGREPNGPLVNLTDGGDGVSNPSDETRVKMRLAKLGKKQTPEHVASRMRPGRYVPPEVGLKISASKMGYHHTAESIQKMSDNAAAKRPEVAAKISIATRLAMADPEIVKKMREAKLGTKWSLARRAAHEARKIGLSA